MVVITPLPGALLFVAALVVPRPTWRFFAEEVRLEIVGESLRVRGEYRFTRGEAGALPIFYPFPADSGLGIAEVESLAVARNGRWVPLAWQPRLPSGVLWVLPEDGSDTVAVRVVYTQALAAPRARYIVKSALAWGAPLDRARFIVCLPEGSREPRFTLPLRAAPDLGPRCYAGLFDPFTPGEDLIVRWHPP